jgi:hypothetical protein
MVFCAGWCHFSTMACAVEARSFATTARRRYRGGSAVTERSTTRLWVVDHGPRSGPRRTADERCSRATVDEHNDETYVLPSLRPAWQKPLAFTYRAVLGIRQGRGCCSSLRGWSTARLDRRWGRFLGQ